MSAHLVLLADIGGTNARFALGDPMLPAPLLLDSVRQVAAAGFPTLVAAAQHYLAGIGVCGRDLHSGVFAVAGRVDGDTAQITNHPWLISGPDVARALGLESLALINDFTAQALATQLLEEADLVQIGNPALRLRPSTSRSHAVLGPGTGLGVSALLVRDGRSIALETEGGHVGFAPSNAEEAQVLGILARQFGRVSNERLLSGGGLVNLHGALHSINHGMLPAVALAPEDVTAGAGHGDPLCLRAVQMFCEVFGSVAGDLVLTLGAWDGAFLCGGLVPKLLPQLQESAFRECFEAKGRFRAAMAQVPTLAVLHPHAGLLGAAAAAIRPALRSAA